MYVCMYGCWKWVGDSIRLDWIGGCGFDWLVCDEDRGEEEEEEEEGDGNGNEMVAGLGWVMNVVLCFVFYVLCFMVAFGNGMK